MSAVAGKQVPLPGILADIERIAGRKAALRIAVAHGGHGEFYVPRHPTGARGQAFADVVGSGAAARIMKVMGGEAISVPLARRAVVQWLCARGMTSTQIADRLRITRRTARRYIKAARDKQS